MLNPISPGVLAAAALASSPALYSAFQGTMPIDVALTRYLITVLVAWALLSIAKSYVTSAHLHTRRVAEQKEAEAAAKAAAEAVQAVVTASSNGTVAGDARRAADSSGHPAAGAA